MAINILTCPRNVTKYGFPDSSKTGELVTRYVCSVVPPGL